MNEQINKGANQLITGYFIKFTTIHLSLIL